MQISETTRETRTKHHGEMSKHGRRQDFLQGGAKIEAPSGEVEAERGYMVWEGYPLPSRLGDLGERRKFRQQQ